MPQARIPSGSARIAAAARRRCALQQVLVLERHLVAIDKALRQVFDLVRVALRDALNRLIRDRIPIRHSVVVVSQQGEQRPDGQRHLIGVLFVAHLMRGSFAFDVEILSGGETSQNRAKRHERTSNN